MRDRSRRWGLVGSLGLALAALPFAWHVLRVAPYRVALTEHRIEGDVRTPIRVLHLSDLHSKGFGAREQTVLALARRARPDLIVVTGDSVTEGAACSAAATVLDGLEAPLGVLMVPGNWEYWMAREQGPSCLCPSSRVRCLRNEAVHLRDDLWIYGVDDVMAGAPELALADIPGGAQLLVLAHEPTTFDLLERPAIVLAGHTHGGQVCLPGKGPLWLPPESGPYVSGWYEQGDRRMYVSRGVGTSLVPVRLGCEPEIALIELVPRSREAPRGGP